MDETKNWFNFKISLKFEITSKFQKYIVIILKVSKSEFLLIHTYRKVHATCTKSKNPFTTDLFTFLESIIDVL